MTQNTSNSKLWSNISIRYQIIIRQVIIIFILILIFVIFSLQNGEIIINKYSVFSQETSQVKDENQLIYSTSQIANRFRSLFRKDVRHIYYLQFVHNYAQANIQQENKPFPSCLQENLLPPQYFVKTDWWCFSKYGNLSDNQTEDDYISQFLDIANQYLFLKIEFKQDVSLIRNLYYSYSSDSEIFIGYPFDEFYPGYHPHERIWYKMAQEKFRESNISQILFSEPYNDFTFNDLVITITKPMMSIEGQFNGVIAADFSFSQLKSLSYNSKFNCYTYLIDTQGRVLVQNSNKEDVEQYDFIYKEQIYGFNQYGWDQIKNKANGRQFTGNCNTQAKNTKLLCLYNSLIGNEIIIEAIFVREMNFYVIQFLDQQYLETQIFNMVENINQNINQYTQYSVCLILGVGLLATFCVFVYLKFILEPLEILIQFTKIKLNRRKAQNSILNNNKFYQVDSDELLNKLVLKSKNSNPTFQKLFFSYMFLLDLIQQQSNIQNQNCIRINKIQFPKINGLYKLRINGFLKQLKNLKLNQKKSENNYKIQKINQITDEYKVKNLKFREQIQLNKDQLKQQIKQNLVDQNTLNIFTQNQLK